MLSQQTFKSRALGVLDRYGIVSSGVFIFGYYLWVALDLFTNPHARRDFNGYFFQFSSVILLWGLVYLGSRLFDYKKKQKEEHEKNRNIAQEFERRRMQLELLDEVSTVLEDTVNNPLSVISLSASSIRQRFESDDAVIAYLDSIDGALKRVKDVLMNFKMYQTSKIVRSIQETSPRRPAPREEKVLTVTSSGDIQAGV